MAKIIGKHAVYSLYGCKGLNNHSHIKKTILEAVVNCGATFIKDQEHSYSEPMEHCFTPVGYSLSFILAESHVSCHSWPQYNFIYVDVFGCGNIDISKFTDTLLSGFDPDMTTIQELNRSVDPENDLASLEFSAKANENIKTGHKVLKIDFTKKLS